MTFWVCRRWWRAGRGSHQQLEAKWPGPCFWGLRCGKWWLPLIFYEVYLFWCFIIADITLWASLIGANQITLMESSHACWWASRLPIRQLAWKSCNLFWERQLDSSCIYITITKTCGRSLVGNCVILVWCFVKTVKWMPGTILPNK